MNTSKPISIPRSSRSLSVNLDNIHFTPPELRNRVETIPIELQEDEIKCVSKSLSNIDSRIIGSRYYHPSTSK